MPSRVQALGNEAPMWEWVILRVRSGGASQKRGLVAGGGLEGVSGGERGRHMLHFQQ